MTLTVATEAPASPQATRRPLLPEGLSQGAVSLFVGLCVAGPLLPLLYASFRSKPLYEAGGAFTLTSYRELFADPAFWRASRATLEFATLATLGGVIVGAAFAVICTRTDALGAGLFRRLAVLPILLPPLGVILGWNSLYGQAGFAEQFLTQTLHLPWDLHSLWGMGILGAATTMPLAFLTCQATLVSGDTSLEDAARSAGASPARVLRHVTIPMLRPALLNSALLIFILAFETLGIPLLLGTPHNIDFVASYLYRTWNSSSSVDPGSVSAGAALLLVVATFGLIIRNRLLGAEARFVSVGSRSGRTSRPLGLGKWRIPIGAGMALYLLLTTFAPLAALALSSFVRVLTPTLAPWHLLTLNNWQALTQPTFEQSIRNSMTIGLVGALTTTAVVAAAALIADRSQFRGRVPLRFLMLYPRSMPGIIVGLGFFWTFLVVDPPGATLRNSIWGPMLALSVRSVTLVYLLLYPAMTRISTSLDAASRSVGATWWTTVRKIVLPLMRPALLTACLLAFVSIVNDYDPVLFLTHPGNQVMGTTMLETFHQGIVGPVAALAMLQVLITAAAIGIAGRLVMTRLLGGQHSAISDDQGG